MGLKAFVQGIVSELYVLQCAVWNMNYIDINYK
jgi:hypothetical protein